MFEDSLEGFVAHWKAYAAQVRLFPRSEGSPLLECLVGEAIVQVFERTGPYLAPPGAARLIVNPTTERLERAEEGKRLEVLGLSRLRAGGVVLRREGNVVVIDAGVPLVVGVHEPIPEGVAAGEWVAFESLSPVHGFVLREPVRRHVRPADGESV